MTLKSVQCGDVGVRNCFCFGLRVSRLPMDNYMIDGDANVAK